MSLVKEFKEFAMRGNVVDLAVAVVIGGAFGKIVASFVSDILMPPLGLLLGGMNFEDLLITIKRGVGDIAPVTINYGMFVQNIVDFLIIAFAIFMIIKAINSAKKRSTCTEAPEAPTKIRNF